MRRRGRPAARPPDAGPDPDAAPDGPDGGDALPPELADLEPGEGDAAGTATTRVADGNAYLQPLAGLAGAPAPSTSPASRCSRSTGWSRPPARRIATASAPPSTPSPAAPVTRATAAAPPRTKASRSPPRSTPTRTEAILWHGGEATTSVARYRALPAADRAALTAFLMSL